MKDLDDPNEPISVVEDLDPEPPSNSRLPQRLEVLVGIVLLVGVLAFVGWQWWHTQVQTNAYNAGETALASNDWDAAVANFTQAGDYKDSAQQAQRAQQQVDARNKLYTSAQQHITSSEWLPALIDVRAAAEIQSGYKELASWEEQALAGVYTDALSGTVAMRPYADPPGLYMRGADSWIYLQGSDRQSTLEQTPHNGRLVFDAEDTIGNPGSRHLESALLVGDQFEYMPVNFDWISASDPDGVWTTLYTLGSQDAQATVDDPVIRESFQGFSEGAIVAYEPYTSSVSYTITPPPSFTDSTGSDLIVAVGSGARYLAASYTGAISSSVAANTVVNVYLGEVNNPSRELIYTFTGGNLQSAQISPTGHYALITTARAIRHDSEEQTSILIDLNNIGTSQIVRDSINTDAQFMSSGYGLQSIFVQSGIYEGDLLLAQSADDHTDVLLLDPAKIAASQTSGALIASATIAGASKYTWLLIKQNANGLVLVGENLLPDPEKTAQTLFAVTIPASGGATVQSIVTQKEELLDSFQTSRSKVAWSYSSTGLYDSSSAVSSIPITTTASNSNNLTPTQIYSEPDAAQQTLATYSQSSLSLGDNLLAYVTDNQLYVRTYDGKLDLKLESDVGTLWNKSSFDHDHDMLK